jgi:hypothetical protein
MTGTGSYRYFLSRFFLQACGSWAITPIGFLVAQALGQGANEYIYLYLTIASLSIGGSLILNEILAPQKLYLIRRSSWITKSEFACFSLSTLSILFYFFFLTEGIRIKVPGLAMVFLLSSSLAASWLSYGTSSLFCRALTNESFRLPKKMCLALGLLPTLASQLFVILISLADSRISVNIGYVLVGLTIFTPSFVQYIFVMASLSRYSARISSARTGLIKPFRYELIAILATASTISITTTLLKSRIADSANSYSNLAFLVLNIVATIAMISAKSSFLIGSPGVASSSILQRLLAYIISAGLSVLAHGAHLLLPSPFGGFIAYCAFIILLSICLQLLLRSTRSLSLF